METLLWQQIRSDAFTGADVEEHNATVVGPRRYGAWPPSSEP
ncbi:hypothetical protein ACWEV3_36640 [Saccharopolyspora sp. NPDC003752]